MPGTLAFRGLLLLAVVVPFVLLAFYAPEDKPVADPPQERDLRAVYNQLSARSNFELFHRWCPLRVQPATPSEAALLQKQLDATPASQMVTTAPMTKDLRPDTPLWRNYISRRIEWLRVNHTKDPHQWIGVGNMRFQPAGNRWVVVRVPMGFDVEE